MSDEGVHPLTAKGDLYTPITPQLLQLLVRMRRELGGTWAEVCAASGTRKRVLRRIYRLEYRAVSMELMDRLIQATEIGHVSEFIWFTAEDLVALGIWEPVEYELLHGSAKDKHRARVLRYNARMRLKRRMRRVRRREELSAIKNEGRTLPSWTPPWEVSSRQRYFRRS